MKKATLEAVIEKYWKAQIAGDMSVGCPEFEKTENAKVNQAGKNFIMQLFKDLDMNTLWKIAPEATAYAILGNGIDLGYLLAKMEEEERAKAAIN